MPGRTPTNRGAPYLMLLGLAAVVLSASAETGFNVRGAHTRLVDEVYLLDATVDFAFSQQSLDAFENGVPITVLIDLEIVKPREYWWDERVANVQARFRLERHALSDTYVVRNLGSGEKRTFGSFSEMLYGLGTIRSFPLLDQHLIDHGEPHRVRMRARLDIEALPSPLRPLAYLSSLWRVKSEWYEWPIAP